MPILALGVSYRRASVEVLERLAFTGDDDPKAYRRLLEPDAVTEGVLLSTCNRVEVYAHVASYHSGFQELKRFLSESREIAMEDFAEPLYSHYEVDAAEHLFSVAAGIDSVVLGEPQILTQVRQAFARAQAERAVGPMLSALFRGAIRAGRRARAETSISSSPAAFVAAGLDLAERTTGSLRGHPAVVVGAGGMASLAAAELRRRGIGPIRVVSRNLDRARRLAASVEAESDGLDRLAHAIAGADLVASSTGAPQVVIGRRPVEVAMRLRGDRPFGLFFLDLAVPRDVDPSVAELPGMALADLDHIKEEVLLRRPAEPAEEFEAARALVSEEVERFEAWRRAARLAPLIQALRDRGERALAAEVARLGPRLSYLSDRDREIAVALARGVVAKLLHDPIVRLKDRSSGQGRARALTDLFGLEPPPQD